MKNLLFTLVLSLTLTGCMNLVVRPVSDYNNGPYFCTGKINDMIEKCWNGDKMANVFVLPLCIDWPFDALTDTVLWPWDAFWYSKRMRKNERR